MGKIRATRAAAKKSVKLVRKSPAKSKISTEEISQTTFDPSKADQYLESDSWLETVTPAIGKKSLKSTPIEVKL